MYALLFKLLGWALGLGLILGEFTYYSDGHTDGLTVGAGWLILGWWLWSTFGRAIARESRGSGHYNSIAPVVTPNVAAYQAPGATPAAPPVGSVGADAANIRRLIDALDAVLDDAVALADVEPSEWSTQEQGTLIAFSRMLLTEATSKHTLARQVGGSPQEAPYLQLAAALRPTLEQARALTSEQSAESELADPVRTVLLPLAVPIQQALNARVREDVFGALQDRVYPEL